MLLQHFLFRFLVHKFLYIGTQSKAFFNYYGVPDKRLVFTPYAVDNQFFRTSWMDNKDRLPEIKTQLGLPADKKIVLFSGKYIPKKNPLDLLRAFKELNNDRYFLVMAGDGPLRSSMEAFIQQHDLQQVRLTGFVNQSEIPLYYAIADVFVMCSGMGETWGLSVNEAMNFAKPVIVSNTCGCSTDLVIPGENGFVFEEGNIQALTDCLKKLLEDDQFRKRAGDRSLSIIDNYSIGHIVHNIQEAL